MTSHLHRAGLTRVQPSFLSHSARQALVSLDRLPTWSDDGPQHLLKYPLPRNFSAKYPVNSSINCKVSFWMGGDSARLATDAIVNAANSELTPGGGICGAIHTAAGPQLAAESRRHRPCRTGKAIITPGFQLPASHVIHAVGPVGENPAMLRSAYSETLKFINGSDVRSIGLCCISTGIYGYPVRPAAHIALDAVRNFLEQQSNFEKTDRIVFVVFDGKDVKVYNELIPTYFPFNSPV